MMDYEKIYFLQSDWQSMTQELWEDEFDYEKFRQVAKETFNILFEYHSVETVPKELLLLLFEIKEFAFYPVMDISEECDAAKLVANEFCNQISDCWVGTEDGIDKNTFVVMSENGTDCLIDTETFDLSELIENSY